MRKNDDFLSGCLVTIFCGAFLLPYFGIKLIEDGDIFWGALMLIGGIVIWVMFLAASA